MTLLIAPVHDGGSYLFIFLLIYATLCSLYLHHVQSANAAVSLFDVYDRFAVKVITIVRAGNSVVINKNFALTTMVHLTSVNSVSSPLRPCRRLWDPGGMSSASVWAKHASVGLSRRCTMSMATASRRWIVYRSRHGIDRSFYPGTASSVSVFHYCHPVLSRQTVPNIHA